MMRARFDRKVGVERSGSRDAKVAAIMSGAIGVAFAVGLASDGLLASTLAALFLLPAVAFATRPVVLGSRLVFFSLWLPHVWDVRGIVDVDVSPFLAIHGNTYGIRVIRKGRLGSRSARVASSYSGTYGFTERTMLTLVGRLKAAGSPCNPAVLLDRRS